MVPTVIVLASFLCCVPGTTVTQDTPVGGETGDTGVEAPDDPAITGGQAGDVVVNEFLARSPGTEHDWIELFNRQDYDIDLLGWSITDDLDEPEANVFSSTLVIPAHGWLLLDACQCVTGVPSDLNFALNWSGEQIGLYDADGDTSGEFNFGIMASDQTAALFPDGGESWQYDETPTPGAANGEAP